MRGFILVFAVLLTACGSQQQTPLERYQRHTAADPGFRNCEEDPKSLWACGKSGESADRSPVPIKESPVQPLAAESPATPEPQLESAPSDDQLPSRAIDSADRYVVQVAAYRDQPSAKAAAREIRMHELILMTTRRNGEDWYVLVIGKYPDRDRAREAGRSYLDFYPEGSVWVRPSTDVSDLRPEK